MILEVSISYSEYDSDYEVHVWDVEEQEKVEDLERVGLTEQEANDYVDSLVKDKAYVVTHV